MILFVILNKYSLLLTRFCICHFLVLFFKEGFPNRLSMRSVKACVCPGRAEEYRVSQGNYRKSIPESSGPSSPPESSHWPLFSVDHPIGPAVESPPFLSISLPSQWVEAASLWLVLPTNWFKPQPISGSKPIFYTQESHGRIFLSEKPRFFHLHPLKHTEWAVFGVELK